MKKERKNEIRGITKIRTKMWLKKEEKKNKETMCVYLENAFDYEQKQKIEDEKVYMFIHTHIPTYIPI